MKEKLLFSAILMSLLGGQQAQAGNWLLPHDPEVAHAPLGVLQASENVAIKGKVVSGEDEQPLPGVTVMVKGSSTGTITDVEGNYSMMAPRGSVLVFSFIGYNSEEIAVGDQSTINVELVPDLKQLEEVIIVGYGEQKRANLTGSVAQISAEKIEDIPVGNISQALVGRLPGVKVGIQTGKPGEANPITIRTTSSYGAAETPLYVIDGIIFNDNGEQLNRLDASEIESISFLKDGSAAVYGARAAGGVVLVTTKRGKKGKPKISYSTSLGIGNPTQMPEMMSPRAHAELLNENLHYQYGKYHTYDLEAGQYIPHPEYQRRLRADVDLFTEDELAALDTLNYDWLDRLYKNAITQRHTLNVSGGSDNVRYFVGGSYFKETGNIETVSASRYSIRTNVDANVTKDLVLSVGLSINRGNKEEPYYSGETSPGKMGDFYKRLLTAPAWIPPTIYDPTSQRDLPVFLAGSWNPYGLLESNNYKSSTTNNTNLTGALEYNVPVIKGLQLKAQFSYNELSGRGRQFAQDYYGYNFRRVGQHKHIFTDELTASNPLQTIGNKESLYESANRDVSYQLNTSISYKRSFNDHNIEALLVYEQAENEGSSFNILKNGADVKGYDQLWAFKNDGMVAGSNANESGRLASIGRLNYNFKEKYLFETAFRYEASQVFHPDYAWGFFPSVSGGWIISEENFFRKNVSFMDFLKLRASVGRLGNSNVGAFQWKQSYGANTNGPIFGNTFTNAIEAKNFGIFTPTITWQKTDFYNLGIDTRFFDNRVNVGIDAYYKNTYDILDKRNNLPETFGSAKPPNENYGSMYAHGLEFQAGYTGNIGNDFQYSVGGNISWDYARRTKVYQNPAVLGRWDDYLINHPSNQTGYLAGGIIRTDEDLRMVLNMYDSINGLPVQKGMIWYHDIRGDNYSEGPDGKINEFDNAVIAEFTSPPYNYGFTLGASWKGLRLSGTFSGAFGHKVFIQKDEQAVPTMDQNVFSFWGDYWTEDNPNAAMPRPYEYGHAQQHSTFWRRDGHTLRLNNVNLSYALPSVLKDRYKLPQFRLYFTGTNMWTIINPFDHKDPSVARAYDYPMIRSYNFGINVTL